MHPHTLLCRSRRQGQPLYQVDSTFCHGGVSLPVKLPRWAPVVSGSARLQQSPTWRFHFVLENVWRKHEHQRGQVHKVSTP